MAHDDQDSRDNDQDDTPWEEAVKRERDEARDDNGDEDEESHDEQDRRREAALPSKAAAVHERLRI
ncbi:MAG: hypothetical protein HRT34_13115, partial [Alcanivorax sp.]|nr:hypothetical protein [Alcanivorax sp.]